MVLATHYLLTRISLFDAAAVCMLCLQVFINRVASHPLLKDTRELQAS